jgi:methylated-DNA-[protein]-cysteine S-methyltransferase
MTRPITKIILMTPVGRVSVQATETELLAIKLLVSHDDTDNELISSAVADKAINQLKSYFIDAHHKWSLPLAEQGTSFQQKVWQCLSMITAGETRTYSQIADQLGSSARAVANACKANPYAIVIPCHRVVSKSGLGGYYGKTDGKEIEVKRWLLDHEAR